MSFQQILDNLINNIQNILNFNGCKNVQFQKNGIGKIGTTGYVLGILGGLHIGFLISCYVFSTMIFCNFNENNVSKWEILIPFHTQMQWSLYFSLLTIFHFVEFFTTAVHQPDVLSYTSYLVNHSKEYTIAALMSWSEFWIESYFFGSFKTNKYFIIIGLILVIFGQCVRTIAMWTCGEHFSHLIMESNSDSHKLITGGIYSVLRHPSYFGWFYWSIGTQIILCNPICFIFYSYASWKFFAGRIPYEESLLEKFYPGTYKEYKKRTYIGIPFIHDREYNDHDK